MHKQWRDCQEWRRLGLPLGTTSNEVAKLYDAALTQYVSWYEEDSLGGLETTVGKIIEAEPEFAMGHVLANGLDLLGTGRSPLLDPEFKDSLSKMAALSQKAGISDWERKHIKAVDLCGKGHMRAACDIWEDILVTHPRDMLAIKFAHDSYFYLSSQSQMRDSVARVLPHWDPSMPLYGYLMGMYSFGLVETNFYAEAEKTAAKGLELNPSDCWSTHSMAHVLEMTGRQNDGITFLSKTVTDWEPCGMLACHNFWHWALYHIEKGEYQGAFDIYDSEIGKRVKSGAMLDIVDAASLLWRLEMEGQNVGDRWESVYEISRPHVDDHLLVFNDVHLLMSCLGAKERDTTQKMINSIQNFVQNAEGDQKIILSEVGEPLCKAFVAYDEGDYQACVDLLLPIRYKVINIGGSNAQRDLFNIFLIQAALRSPSAGHHKLARHLLAERKVNKESAPMTDRLMGKALALHAD